MRIAVASCFRNSAGRQVSRWMDQVAAFRSYMKHDGVRALCVEGDSIDNTRQYLIDGAARRDINLELRTCNHGGPVYGSVEDPARMLALSKVGNELFAGVTLADDVVIYVESDLLWDPATFARLVQRVTQPARPLCDVVAPLIFAGQYFYDVWGFRKSGQRFSPLPPYHSELAPQGLTMVDSVGSCLAIRSEVARNVKFGTNALVSWCEGARHQGYRIAVDPSLRVEHPA